jgi:hypothetical protein
MNRLTVPTRLSDSGSDPSSDSYGRTDGLTDNLQDEREDLTFRNVRAHTAIDEVLGWLRIGVEAERHELVRSGEREPILWTTRFAVLLRDARTCKRCGRHCATGGANWAAGGRNVAPQVDHITPWSAGGSDRTNNLRTLCGSCNNSRSNFRDIAEDRRVLPCTWWCVDCWAEDLTVHDRWHAVRPEQRFCWLTNTHRDDLLDYWHSAPHLDIDQPLVLAYCAHCDATGYTTVTL